MLSRPVLPRLLIGLCCLGLLIFPAFAQDAPFPDDERLLVWWANGISPGLQLADNPGQIAFVDNAGNLEMVLQLPNGTERVLACGDKATSPNGDYFTFYAGDEIGTLYMMRGIDTLFAIASDIQALTCAGNRTFLYTDDSQRFAYLDFEDNINVADFASGRLQIGMTSNFAITHTFEQVTAFDTKDETIAFIQFFTNDQGQAIEAGIVQWQGEVGREVATLFADNGCEFTSSSITVQENGQFAIVMGHKCVNNGGTSWQFYTVNPENRSVTLVLQNQQAGGFFAFSRTNNVYVAPDAETAYFTAPDGATNFSVGMFAVNFVNSSAIEIFPNSGIMPRYYDDPYAPINHPPAVSADGNWLAVSRNNLSDEASINILDLSAPELPPIMAPAGARGDVISEILFTPDNEQLIFVAGGAQGINNSIFAVDLATGTTFRVKRGRFANGLMSPTGDTVAIMNWQLIDEDEPLFLTLQVINIESGVETTLLQGADIVNNQVTNRRFAYPLSWRQAISDE